MQNIQPTIILLLAFILIPNCVAQSPPPTSSPSTTASSEEEKPFYENLDTLKYIAIAALLVLICCCLALIIFVRRQVRKTEQGTEIQQYIRKKKESGDITGHGDGYGNGNGHRIKLSNDQSNTYTQTQTNTINNGHGTHMMSNGSSADLYGHNGHNGSTMNINQVGGPSAFPNPALSLDSTPGEAMNGAAEQDDIKKELEIIKMNEAQHFRKKMADADKKEQIEEFKEEDERFIGDLEYNIERLHSEENKMFHEMERDNANLKNQQMQHPQNPQYRQPHGNRNGYH